VTANGRSSVISETTLKKQALEQLVIDIICRKTASYFHKEPFCFFGILYFDFFPCFGHILRQRKYPVKNIKNHLQIFLQSVKCSPFVRQCGIIKTTQEKISLPSGKLIFLCYPCNFLYIVVFFTLVSSVISLIV